MIKLATLALFSQLWTTGCNSSDEGVFKGGSNESKPVRTLLQGGEGLDALGAKDTDDVTEAASVTYGLKVTSNSGAQLCAGEITLVIMSDFGMKFPEAKMKCMNLTIDLASMLGASGGLGKPGKSGDANISHDGQVLSVRNLAGAEFEPPRPFLLGPIVQDVDAYDGFTRSTEHSIKAKDLVTGKEVSGTGKFNIEVHDNQTTYTNKYIDKGFDKVMHWSMTTTGFDGVQAKHGLIFEKWEWLWNTRPIMIPKLVLVGRLSDFMESEDGSAEALVGKLTVELVVRKYEFK